MRIIADTNVFLRLLVTESPEDTRQTELAAEIIENAEEVTAPTHVFCELVWVLFSTYKFSRQEVIAGIKSVLSLENLVCREDEVEAGMSLLEKGGDFADGVNAYTGRLLSTSRKAVFVSFDKKAVRLVTDTGANAMLLEVKNDS